MSSNSASPPAAWVMPVIAVSVLGIFAGALAASCFLGNDTLRTQMFTGALTLAAGVASYFFGSSAGSAKKDDTIAASSAALAISSPVIPAAADPVSAPAAVAPASTGAMRPALR
jgi:hypothetical protein